MHIPRYKQYFCLSLLLTPIIFLSGCFPGCEKKEVPTEAIGDAISVDKEVEDGSEVLLKINGRKVITAQSLDDAFNQLLEESPQLKQVLPFMPEAKLNFFQGLVSQEVVNEYIRRNDIDRTPEYQKDLEKTVEQVKNFLNSKYFSDRHPVQVSESEVRKFYEENKGKSPHLMISQGGVKAEGVSFNKEEDAKAFLAKVKESPKQDLEKLAKDAGYQEDYKDFKMVNNQSLGIDPTLRTKIIGLKRFPSDELFKIGDIWWVIRAHKKDEPQYYPFEQVKTALEDQLKKQKQMEVFEKAIDKYKKEYNVEINETPLQQKPEPQLPEAAKAAANEPSSEPMAVADNRSTLHTKKETAQAEVTPRPATQTV